MPKKRSPAPSLRCFGLLGTLPLLSCGCSGTETPRRSEIAARAGAGGVAGGGVGTAGTSSAAGAGGNAGGGAQCPAPPAGSPGDDEPTEMPEADPGLAGDEHRFFEIVVKSADGIALRGATLSTVNRVDYVSDDSGVVAFYEPGLMGREVFFHITHPGFEYPVDGFGFRGKALLVEEGGSAELVLQQASGAAGLVQGDLQSRLSDAGVPGPAECFAIRVYDAVSLRGVPLVRFSAHGEELWSDSQGLIAYCNPDHLPQAIAFDVFAHGYELEAGDGTVELTAAAGGNAEVALTRSNLAERLYRITGAGIYRDSVLLGLKAPIERSTLNAQIMGQDTASTAVYRGKLFWLWQDTDRVSYPLGNFKGTAAISELPQSGGLSPSLGVDLDYFESDDGFASAMCPDCPGLAWMDGLVSVPNAAGDEQLFGGYAIASGDSDFTETGMVRFDDVEQRFERVLTDFNERAEFTRPDAHPYRFRHGDEHYVYYGNRVRIPARAESYLAPDEYERFTPYAAGASAPEVADDGSLVYAWRAEGVHATSERLAGDGAPTAQDLDGHMRKADSGAALVLVGAAVTWNRHRRRFLRIGQEQFGASSALGEIWLTEADTPVGPWLYARQLVTHQSYTFYNAFFHPEFDRGPFVYFEGTYTATYSGATTLTPRYNYNQLMYRVNLEEPELSMPVPVYALEPDVPTTLVTKAGLRGALPRLSAAFLAFDRPRADAVAVAWSGAACAPDRRLVATSDPPTAPLFYALSAEAVALPDGAAALFEFTHDDGRRAYALADASLPEGFQRSDSPLAFVWQNPVKVKLPVGDYLGELIVNAGPDQCLQAGAAGVAEVVLDASLSAPGESEVTRYLWRAPGARPCEYAHGKSVTFELAPGVHTIELEVADEAGNVSHDTVTVQIT